MDKFFGDRIILYQGDCLNVLKEIPNNTFDSACIDGPYELNFMNRKWDATGITFRPETWTAVYRVLKPGAHMVVFGGSRTFHRMACAIEDAGFEIREMLVWVTGQNFPKSINVSRVIDERKGLKGEVVQSRKTSLRDVGPVGFNRDAEFYEKSAPVSEEAKQWEGWGTALKNSLEPICLARKPLAENTIVDNVLEWGTGALNIDSCRVGRSKDIPGSLSTVENKVYGKGLGGHKQNGTESGHNPNIGRWPPNVLLDDSQEVQELFPQSSVTGERTRTSQCNTVKATNWLNENHQSQEYIDSGSTARFFPQFDRTLFYNPKASHKDRMGTNHPTVKPVALLRWLIRLITPPEGRILDCFAGTGTTGQAAVEEGFKATLIEREEEYCADIRQRMKVLAREAIPPDNRPVLRKNKDDSTLEEFL